MHPAFSVLIFTVTSGAGYGLLAWLGAGQLLGFTQTLTVNQQIVIGLMAMVLVSIGLASSTMHLANPKNAWRSFSRFRTSWLSREAVFAILLYPVAGLYAAAIFWQWSGINILAGLSMILALVTLFTTSMIYASLKTIRQWNTPMVPALFMAYALISGGVLFLAVDAFFGTLKPQLQAVVMGLVVITLALKLVYFFWQGKPQGATIQTATGFSQASVRLLDAGHSAPTFLNREFGYQVAADQLLRLRVIMTLVTFIVPLALVYCVFGGLVGAELLGLAWLIMMAGLLLERWLFFAEARHVVRLYQGEQRT
ncbi:dimethyl sulfoxide reductase anchor subunit [Oceanospirillaceae bacterium]|jgi:DMSO reductase anchor subunit|nr:dimethyl sulfoxide reductase anchor subunit [Oceanospirillaceae bacterium]MBT5630515.1 dimethyl sulfoxide reductase anchor subunit [Oceanospirillaceae bacterium]MBT7674324.1 dimethyl sulfoxide reductase anchor subunit [Oceanospirillaceae bacterium]MDB0065567.1 dimethyl sulfoxide reductase anchor subunit [Oceanospirillaceae bacterium]MDB9905344.1 dimethyl sulfoxide reductase anchor subunit [Oceanospirillaceae bacterium]|tara:strand:+ start:251 stop:1180 length:930 start_codon:yes stop_codon:yes gene_type:complete